MKKLLLFITILAIGLYYVNEKTDWITNRTYEITDVSKASTFFLHKLENQEHVYGFSVHITGHIDGKANIKLYQSSDKGNVYKSKNVSGNVDMTWGGDWYADSLKIEYVPLSNIRKGLLSLEYAFDGM